MPAVSNGEQQWTCFTGGGQGWGARRRVAAWQLWVSERGGYNAAEVWVECIIMALLRKGYVHYNVCSSCMALGVPWKHSGTLLRTILDYVGYIITVLHRLLANWSFLHACTISCSIFWCACTISCSILWHFILMLASPDGLCTLCKVGKLGLVTTNRFKWAVDVGMFIWLATAGCQSWGSVWIALDGRSPAIHNWHRYMPNSDAWCPGQCRLEGETKPRAEISIANENQQVWLCTSGASSNPSSPMSMSISTSLAASWCCQFYILSYNKSNELKCT